MLHPAAWGRLLLLCSSAHEGLLGAGLHHTTFPGNNRFCLPAALQMQVVKSPAEARQIGGSGHPGTSQPEGGSKK